jgi:RHH-type proline utilization regulon transcriptional repressor/proline dehydrogenase/delta 1-pyrroline-5-carboxylate dehydrogenase
MFESLHRMSTEVGSKINLNYLADESELLGGLLDRARCSEKQRIGIEATAVELVDVMRRERAEKSGLDAFLMAYDLSSTEGVVLMCLAEALLRIPDAETADMMIADRLGAGDWEQHLGASESLFVNASTWGLMLTGRLIKPSEIKADGAGSFVRSLVSRLGEPVVRSAMIQAMRIMGRQFVMGRDIGEALRRSSEADQADYRFSFDMLGEAALTAKDAEAYFQAYLDAIDAVGADQRVVDDVLSQQSISVKLSALSPRLEFAQLDRVMREVVPRVVDLVVSARRQNVPLTLDAEEASRLELTLAVFEAVYKDPKVGDWEGLGIAVQTYQRRAPDVISWLADLAAQGKRRIPTRLVKGAYWDTEIKMAQEFGLASYPVYTRKINTDVSYLACVRMLLDSSDHFLPQFATHNAHTVAYILHVAPTSIDYEFQRLHGMGEALYDRVMGRETDARACRVYAPVGRHEDLLPYLVRRLLENGANTSFVNRIVQEETPAAELVEDPVNQLDKLPERTSTAIPAPAKLYGRERSNSAGFNLYDGLELARLADAMQAAINMQRVVRPVIDGQGWPGDMQLSTNPFNHQQQVGRVGFADAAAVDRAVEVAKKAFAAWNRRAVGERARILRDTAALFEEHRPELVALCVAEAGKCIPDALSEVREAVDFLRYYASEAERLMSVPFVLPGPTGERNELSLAGRGVFVCISPWNFPVAIFTGQVAAALVTGNTVLAKPAEQTSLVASRVVALFIEAGVPDGVLQFLPGSGTEVGARAVADPRIDGVVFTGSTTTAVNINRSLAARDGALATLIAETGGQNAMIVDSTALAEQVVIDVIQSAFNSAGQRCSALRVLYLQEEVADRILQLLSGHMAELVIGDPARMDTDIGPVIDFAARDTLLAHRQRILKEGTLVYECAVPDGLEAGSFFAPLAVEISELSMLKEEVFGPVLHIIRYRSQDLEGVLEAIEATGYGLTFGFQSRIERRADAVANQVAAGNVYVNRNMVGAVVGVQPFGGHGLSGTGPKAGGPNYLLRFVSERTITVNTAAVGGNANLLTLSSD